MQIFFFLILKWTDFYNNKIDSKKSNLTVFLQKPIFLQHLYWIFLFCFGDLWNTLVSLVACETMHMIKLQFTAYDDYSSYKIQRYLFLKHLTFLVTEKNVILLCAVGTWKTSNCCQANTSLSSQCVRASYDTLLWSDLYTPNNTLLKHCCLWQEKWGCLYLENIFLLPSVLLERNK